jgi:hypothetical protein
MSPAFLRQKSNVTPFYFCDFVAGELSRLRRLKGGQEEGRVDWWSGEVISGKALRRLVRREERIEGIHSQRERERE